jgi:isocitrate dehydrogenase (NAD+)
MATMLSAVMMLRHLGECAAADRMEAAIAAVIAGGRHVTYDLKQERDDPSAAATSAVAEAVAARMSADRHPVSA